MRGRIVACACCVALPAIVGAAEWRTLPQFSLGADADSNRRLRPDARESESGVFGGSLTLARATEISQFALTPHVMVSRYSGEDALDSDDYGMNALYRHNGERLLLNAMASYSNDSTLLTELGETGFVEGNTRRSASSVSVSLAQYLSTRHVLRYQLGASDIDYQRTRGTGLVGYRYPNAAITYTFSATPRLETSFTVMAARLTAQDIGLTNETRGAQAGMRFQMSERFDFTAGIGRSNTESRGRSDTEQNYNAGISWQGERSTIELSAARDIEPSGRGVLVRADDLRLAWTRNLTERLTLDTSLRAARRQDLTINSVRGDYQYGAATLGLSFKLAETWTLRMAGAYSRQDYETATAAADGVRIGLGLTWQPWQP